MRKSLIGVLAIPLFILIAIGLYYSPAYFAVPAPLHLSINPSATYNNPISSHIHLIFTLRSSFGDPSTILRRPHFLHFCMGFGWFCSHLAPR